MEITVAEGSGIELLLFLFRVNNHEKMAHNDGESYEQLSESVLNARLSISRKSLEWLGKFFSWEGFLGLRIVPYLFMDGSPSPSDLVAIIRKTSPERLLSMFFCDDFESPGEPTDVFVKSLEEDERRALGYVSSISNLPSSDRYEALEMLQHQAETAGSFIELLEYARSKLDSFQGFEEIIHSSANLVNENLNSLGSSFIPFLLGIETKSLSVEKIRLYISASLGGSVIKIDVPERNAIISLAGVDRISRRSLLFETGSGASLAGAMSERKSLDLLHLLLQSRQSVSSILELCDLHSHEVVDILAALSRQGLVIPEIQDNNLVFRTEEGIVDDALEEIRSQIIGKTGE